MSQTDYDGSTPLKSEKQERFAVDVASGIVASDAYRKNYSVEKSTDKTVWEHASRLAANAKVRARINHLRQKTAQHTELNMLWNVEKSVRVRLNALKFANEQEDSRSMSAVADGLDKLLGLENASKIDITSSDGSLISRIEIVAVESDVKR